jgi:hypothetical protein
MSALFDFSSLLVVLLLLICASAYVRAWTLKRGPDGELQSWLEAGGKHLGGFRGVAWKAARIGERLSPYVAVSCVVMVGAAKGKGGFARFEAPIRKRGCASHLIFTPAPSPLQALHLVFFR